MTTTPSTLGPAGGPAASAESARTVPSRTSPPETRGERWVRHARRVGLYVASGTFLAVLVVLVALAAANTGSVRLDWLVGATHASLVWIILASAVLGWLLGVTTAIVVHHRTRNPAGH